MAGNVMSVGNLEILALLDARGSIACDHMFPDVPAEAWAPHQHSLAGGDVPLPMASFLITGGGKRVLVDTGVGAKDRPGMANGRLPDALCEAGAPPESIDCVLATHIHIDHVGWHTTQDGDAWRPTFPNAQYIFAEAEHRFFTEPQRAAKVPWVRDCVLPLQGRADVRLVPAEHRVTDQITLLPTPGHTPGHTSFVISSAGETAVILGDLFHTPAQVAEPAWRSIFDLDHAMAARTRESMAARLEAEGWRAAGGHLPPPGFGRVVVVDGARHWRGL
ncbi:MAG: MBL fold metallo-hydrolase [Chloroflexi bacterium]|nr:MBL fold metallo-hydrolase [Chloroflexota bacterium]